MAFEDGLEQLEAVVRRMETATLPLSEALATYEEGVKLHRQLTQMLDANERQLEVLTTVEEGE